MAGDIQTRYREIKGVSGVFTRGNELIITGSPEDSEDKHHNCDEMGCGSIDHVLIKGVFLTAKKGYTMRLQEVSPACCGHNLHKPNVKRDSNEKFF